MTDMIWEKLAQAQVLPNPSSQTDLFLHVFMPLAASYALFIAGWRYLLGIYRFLRFARADMDTLIGISTLTAYLYSLAVSFFPSWLSRFVNTSESYFDVTIIVITFISIGNFLETRAKSKTGDAIGRLLELQAKTAMVLRDNLEFEISIDSVMPDDLIRIRPAGRIPVDGIVVDGNSFVDESMMSGEAIPVEKKEGDSVVAGTLNTSGSFVLRTSKVGKETVLAHIVRLVEEAQGSKAPIQRLADQISSVFVPLVLAAALVSLFAWIAIGTRTLGFAQASSFGLISFVSVLVIACPCALGLATPTAIIVGIGRGAKEGVLIKDAESLERFHKIHTIVLDKTGTITNGKPSLSSLENLSDVSEARCLSLLAALEEFSEHPIAHAICDHADEKGNSKLGVEDFEAIRGKGVRGKIDGIEYFAGSLSLMKDLHLKVDSLDLENDTRQGKTPIVLATRSKILAIALVADSVRAGAREAVEALRTQGLRVVMLTGDNRNTAAYVAGQVGIDEVIAEVMPDKKAESIKALQSKGEGVAMVGDGINDVPALAQADVGIAMATGTDVAIQSASVTLLHGDISKLPRAIHLAKLTMRGIKQNLFWAFFYNLLGIPLAGGLFYPLTGWLLSPAFASLAMAFSSVSVVSNSLRLKTMD